MNYPGEFKERAQIEMSKRLGFKSRTDCINSLGVKEFARKRDEIIIFKDGDKTNCSIENLTIMLKSDNMRRNAIHNYPTELKETIRLKNKLIKKIKSKS